ncbi:GPW/gp25 family protein [Dictyobacter formicarum]|nr:GPW/gp25 family protein [Dictyobacter formicarum]
MTNSADLYGRSLGFPPQVGPNGQMLWSSGESNVRESICIILCTRPGERVLQPDFGCGLDRYLFEPNNTSTLRLIQEEVKRAIIRWEPRVALNDIHVSVNPADQRAVDIAIYYTLIAIQKREQLNLTFMQQV